MATLNTTHSIDINSLEGATMTLNARITKQFWIRAHIARAFFWIGAWVLRCGIEYTEET